MTQPDEKLGKYDMRAIEASVAAWMREQGEVGALPQHLHANWLLMAIAEVRRLRSKLTGGG